MFYFLESNIKHTEKLQKYNNDPIYSLLIINIVAQLLYYFFLLCTHRHTHTPYMYNILNQCSFVCWTIGKEIAYQDSLPIIIQCIS